MAELKVNEGFLEEVTHMQVKGMEINEGYAKITDGNLETLKASVKFLEQHEAIKKLIDLYKELIYKDALDFVDMITKFKEQDDAMAGKYRI